MIKAYPLLAAELDVLRPLYDEFCSRAQTDYRWDHESVPFLQLKPAVAAGLIRGIWVEDTSEPGPKAFMLYCLEEHRAIEINVIYFEEALKDNLDRQKLMLDQIMRLFVKTLQDDTALMQGVDVISYAMLGVQETLIRSILWYGFRPVGQAIVKFNIMDPVTIQILKQQQLPELPEGYELAYWEPQYAGDAAKMVFQSFSNASDALWDPRFRTESGAKKVVGMITGGLMGTHIPTCTSVLLKQGKLVGVCFLVQPSMTVGNIPIIGVLPDEKGHQFGNHLLKHCIDAVIDNMLAGHIAMLEVSATHDTENIAAIKMYRRIGFREDYNYPHIALTKEKLMSVQLGKWC